MLAYATSHDSSNRPTLEMGMRWILSACLLASWTSQAFAGPREQAHRLHTRLASVPPSKDVLAQMELMIANGDGMGAASLALENSNFYSVTLKNWASPWTDKDENARVPLNDYSATVIGMARDNVPFDQILYGDILYIGAVGVPGYSSANNNHYAALETTSADLKTSLVQTKQSIVNPAITDIAGALTTRAFGSAFFNAGTNRAAVRASLLTFTCNDMEQLSDTSIPDFRVRRDVERSPGGDAKVYRNKCAGCHAGMDALGGAFAHFDWNGTQVVFTPTVIAPKMVRNASNFPEGHVALDNSWMNLWTEGQNAGLGWKGPTSGVGVKEYGQMLAASDAFPRCMAKRAFSAVCLQNLKTVSDADVEGLATKFKADGFNLKNLFAAAALQCMGE